ncbi:HlyD family secretion protein [Gallaecimonas kandeliae]|uniref:HlyD family secretion protein n=1 Tax=Gallaecimonas kandeliae TaxID=3029055 RepID=UPI0026497FDF|nr:HlyD family secretion protein [Gallaecimonas kandeliae]WKE65229.1 HlyD family secretion protein [Gallaecimonas kandeliae]
MSSNSPFLKKPFILGALAILALGSLGYWLKAGASQVHETDARIAGEMVNVASRLDGWLMARPVTEGDNIQQGQLLAEVDSRDSKLKLSALGAQIGAAEEGVGQLQAQKELIDKQNSASLDQAKAALAAARAAKDASDHLLTLAQGEFKRIDKLRKKGLSNQQDWDRSHSTLLERQDQLAQAQANIKAMEAGLTHAQATLEQGLVINRQIQVQQQQIQALKAQAAQLQQDIDDRSLRSPVNGVVDKTLAEAGDFVQAGQWLMLIHDPAKVWVEANIKETAIGQIREGQEVTISVDAYPGVSFKGHVLKVGNAATNQFALLPSPNPSGNFTKITQRVPVRIAFDQIDPRLKPGLMVEVDIHVGA